MPPAPDEQRCGYSGVPTSDKDPLHTIVALAPENERASQKAAGPAACPLQSASPTVPSAAAGPRRNLGARRETLVSALLCCTATYFALLACDDLRDHGRVSILNWSVLAPFFAPAALARLLLLWLPCNAAPLLALWGLRLWRAGRAQRCKAQHEDDDAAWLWDRCWTAAALLLHVALIALPIWAAWHCGLPISAKLALGAEMLRFTMKTWSFVVEEVQSVLAQPKNHEGCSLRHLAFYMFAPTLVYQHSFERTARVRVRPALRHVGAFLLSVFAMVVLVGRSTLRPFCGGPDAPLLSLWRGLPADLPARGLLRYLMQFGVVTVRALPAGALVFVGSSIAIASWNGLFAELMRFKPPHPYQLAWWDAPSYEVYFRRWNTLVKAWLVRYVHDPLRRRGVGGTALRLACITFSALWHDIVISAALGYVIPYFGFTYVFGAMVTLVDPLGLQRNKAVGNLFWMSSQTFGMATITAFYFLETAARHACPDAVKGPWSIFVPHGPLCEDPVATCTSFI